MRLCWELGRVSWIKTKFFVKLVWIFLSMKVHCIIHSRFHTPPHPTPIPNIILRRNCKGDLFEKWLSTWKAQTILGGGGVISFRLVNETRTIVLVQAGTQANQFARMIDRAGNVSVTEIRAGRSFFFPEDSKLTCP